MTATHLVEKDTKRLYIDSSQERTRILEEIHDQGGHLGLYKTQEVIRQRFYWPNWSNDVKRHLRSCVQFDSEAVSLKAPNSRSSVMRYKSSSTSPLRITTWAMGWQNVASKQWTR